MIMPASAQQPSRAPSQVHELCGNAGYAVGHDRNPSSKRARSQAVRASCCKILEARWLRPGGLEVWCVLPMSPHPRSASQGLLDNPRISVEQGQEDAGGSLG
jgi:hypothetical protein